MASTPPRREQYKLASEFGEGIVTHRTFKSDLRTQQRRIEVSSTWATQRMLGVGSFGQVRLEREQGSGKLRAVKAISKTQVNTNEVEALIDLQDHPALFVEFLGWFEDPYAVHIAMEYIEHGDLGQFITDHGQQAKAGARDIASQILEGLVVLHERGICHRDLKPQNILMASSSPIWVKITDFGISKYYRGSNLRTHCGTVIYQAPELLGLLPRGMAVTDQSYTINVDIWAFGAVVHEVLTSVIPFLEKPTNADSILDSCAATLSATYVDMDLLFNYCRGQPFPITALQHHRVSPDGIDFVKSLMTANPTNRVSAADALKSRWLTEIPVLQATISGPPQQSVVMVEGLRRGMRPTEYIATRAPSPKQTQIRDLTIQPNRSPASQPQDGRKGQHWLRLLFQSKSPDPILPEPSRRTLPRWPFPIHDGRLDQLSREKPIILIRWVTQLLGTFFLMDTFYREVTGGQMPGPDDFASDVFSVNGRQLKLIRNQSDKCDESDKCDGIILWETAGLCPIGALNAAKALCVSNYFNATAVVQDLTCWYRGTQDSSGSAMAAWDERRYRKVVASGVKIFSNADSKKECATILEYIVHQVEAREREGGHSGD